MIYAKLFTFENIHILSIFKKMIIHTFQRLHYFNFSFNIFNKIYYKNPINIIFIAMINSYGITEN